VKHGVAAHALIQQSFWCAWSAAIGKQEAFGVLCTSHSPSVTVSWLFLPHYLEIALFHGENFTRLVDVLGCDVGFSVQSSLHHCSSQLSCTGLVVGIAACTQLSSM